MPKKKQSARPAGAGWLLEVGVIGIDKTLKLVRLTQRPLLELEHLFRPWSGEGLSWTEKQSLPWRFIERAPFESDSETEDEWEHLGMALEHDEELKAGKGGNRKALYKWRISAEIAKRIKAEFVGYDRNKYLRMKAECRILADALFVISGVLRKVPARYPKEIEERLSQDARGKVAMIIRESLAILDKRKEVAERLLKRSKVALAEHDEKRKHLAFDVELWSERLKKWGKGKR
jgi:hypothetical protein